MAIDDGLELVEEVEAAATAGGIELSPSICGYLDWALDGMVARLYKPFLLLRSMLAFATLNALLKRLVASLIFCRILGFGCHPSGLVYPLKY